MTTSVTWPLTSAHAHTWQLSGYSYTPAAVLESITTRQGLLARSIGRTAPERVTGSVVLSAAETAEIAAWLRYDVGYTGASSSGVVNAWFNAPTLQSGVYDVREVRLVPGSISYQPLGAGWTRMSAEFLTRAGSEMPAGVYETAAALGSVAEYAAMLQALEDAING